VAMQHPYIQLLFILNYMPITYSGCSSYSPLSPWCLQPACLPCSCSYCLRIFYHVCEYLFAHVLAPPLLELCWFSLISSHNLCSCIFQYSPKVKFSSLD
jgi:hypothetical protein